MAWCSASITRRPSGRSSARPSSIPNAADAALGHRLGARPQLQPRHRRSRARSRRYEAIAQAHGARRRRVRRSSAPTSRRWRCAIPPDPKADRAALPQLQPTRWATVAPVSRRSRRRDALRREPDESARRGSSGRSTASRAERHRGDRRRARVGAARAIRITSARTTTTSTPSRRRRRRRARCRARTRLETLAPAAGHWSTCPRTSTRAPAITPPPRAPTQAGAEADRVYLKTAPAGRVLRDGVLLAQPALPRRLRHDAGPVRPTRSRPPPKSPSS